MKLYAGVLIKSIKNGKFYLMLRGVNCSNPLTWSIISGGIEDGETIIDGLKREIIEETSIDPSIIEFKLISKERMKKDAEFYYYEGIVEDEFTPKLDYENLDWGWFDLSDLPEPLYPGLLKKIENYGSKK